MVSEVDDTLKRKIRVDFYKGTTGKWYSGGEVYVEHGLYQGVKFMQDIVNNQQILKDGWQGNYFVVTNNLDGDNDFAKHLYPPDRFVGIVKTK